MPYLWVSGADLNLFDDRVSDDSTVSDVEIAKEYNLEGEQTVILYQIKWSEEIIGMINAIFDQEGTLVEASVNEGKWTIKVRFGDHDSLSNLQLHFDEADVGFSVRKIYSQTEPRRPEFNVTSAQREALVTALKMGYFEIPRESTVSDLADELDISPNAFSERIRRGTTNLVQSTLLIESPID